MPDFTAALHSRAPSMCTARPASCATFDTPCSVASGHTVPQPPLEVFSTETRRERGALRQVGAYGGKACVRAEPFEAFELDLGVLWSW